MNTEPKISSFENYIKTHHIFILTLAICPSLAVTTTFERSYILGFIVLITTILSSIIMNILSKVLKKNLKIYACLLVNAIIVIIWEIFLSNYIPDLYDSLGIYLSIITVNFMVMERSIFYASYNKLSITVKESFKNGFYFMALLSSVGLIREFLGNNTITLMDKVSSFTGYISKYQILPSNDIIPNPLFLTSAGAFLILGGLLSIIYFIKNRSVK